MIKFVFDLDGVLRNLAGYVARKYNAPYPTSWEHLYAGKGIIDRIKEEISCLVDAPPTTYIQLVWNKIYNPEIWTNQPKEWRKLTQFWISTYMGNGCKVRFLTPDEKEERLKKLKNTYLVEDYPYFKNYDRIILIDQPYNQHIKGTNIVRAYNPYHLGQILDNLKEKKHVSKDFKKRSN